MKQATTTKRNFVGEFGFFGNVVVEIYTVHGHSREIRKLWRDLDHADGPEQGRILDRLRALGATDEAGF